MSDLGRGTTTRLTTVLLIIGLGLAACSGEANPSTDSTGATTPSGAATSSTEPASGDTTGSPPAGGVDVQGSLVSSGLYDATWTWQPGNAVSAVALGSTTLNSDKETFAAITVKSDGSIQFSSAAPELSAGSSFAGTDAQVDVRDIQGAQLVCSFTLDNDLTGADGSVLHLTGTLTIVGAPDDGAFGTC